MAETNIYEKLRKVQLELKVPKNQRNSFGGYNYRNAEDILEAVKPVLDKYGLTLLICDELENIGERYYVKATASVFTDKSKQGIADLASVGDISVTAYAREEETKKGMDGSQITGAASSYARKYALNGLFAIDDTKDADSQDNRQEASQKTVKPAVGAVEAVEDVFGAKAEPVATDVQRRQLTAFMRAKGIADGDMGKYLKEQYKVDPATMTKSEALAIMDDLK